MTFLGISSSFAGAEPGRSGFPASYTSLLDCPPAPRLGGLFWPLSGRALVKSVPLPGDDRARIEMSTRAPSAGEYQFPKRFARQVGRRIVGQIGTLPNALHSAPALDLPTGGLIPVGFCLSHLPRRADLQPRAGGFCGALTNRRVSA